MATTLSDVAKAAGVSNATVSRVMNNTARVAPHIVRRVLETMERMGYQQRPRKARIPRSLPAGMRTGKVMLLFAGFDNRSRYVTRDYPEMMRGLEAALMTAGLRLTVANVADSTFSLASLDDREIDGVLLFPYGHPGVVPPVVLERLAQTPTVCLMRDYPEHRGILDSVTYDNGAVGRLAADYLARRGHKRVAFINVDPTHEVMPLRQEAFMAQAAAAGLDATSIVGAAKPASEREEPKAYQALVDQLAKTKPAVTGVFAGADYQVESLYRALAGRGIKPGRNLDIIGCDNSALILEKLRPRPASIDINLTLVGMRGVQQLLWRLANRGIANRTRTIIDPIVVTGA